MKARTSECRHPAIVVQNPSHVGRPSLLVTGLLCAVCGDSVRIELEAVHDPRHPPAVARAMARLVGNMELKRCEFVSIGGPDGRTR